jgi:chromosome segregation ATPase
MKTTTFAVKASLIATMILSGQAFAQNLPDEINGPKYEQIYKNLSTVLSQKIAEYEKLAADKAAIESAIAQLQDQAVKLPAQNAELQNRIQIKRDEISRLNTDIQGLEGVLGKIVEDLRQIDANIARLRTDLNEQSQRNQQNISQRLGIAQQLQVANQFLQKQVNDENVSVQELNRLDGEYKGAEQRRMEVERDRADLFRNVDRFKVEIVQTRNNVNQNNAALNQKKPQLADSQAKLPGVKAELAGEEAKLSQIDVTLNPKKAQLAAMRTEMARLSPDIARLTNENKALQQKVDANQAKINASNVNSVIAKRDALESEIASVKTTINSNNDRMVQLQEEIKPTMGKINELTEAMKQAVRTRNMAEAARLKKEIEVLDATIAPQKQESLRLSKQTEQLALSIAPKQMEITNLNNQINTLNAQNSSLQSEIDASKAKIAQNEVKINEQMQANSGLAQQINALDAEVKALEAQRDPTAKRAAALRQQEQQLSSLVQSLASDIQRLENENQQLAQRISMMENTINTFPQESRRLELHSRQLAEKMGDLANQIRREQSLLERIRPERMRAEQNRNSIQQNLDQYNAEIEKTERIISTLSNKLREETNNRDALTRYNQDSINKLDAARAAKVNAEQVINSSTQTINTNNQAIATNAQDMADAKADLADVTPKVVAAENSRNTAQRNADNASSEWQNRASLYQNYLSQAQSLGAERAAIATTDGQKAGSVEAKAKAQKIAAENATAEAKWEALRRGYVRGEIAGFHDGFDIGMASTPDAVKGEQDGVVAGQRRAKDYANNVVKPQRYLEELERRLRDDETQASKPLMAMMIRQEVSMIKAMAEQLQETIPDLSSAELAEASRIVTSLDSLIAQSDIEIKEVLNLRSRLSNSRNVYAAPGAGANENNPNCSGVYKNVPEFLTACGGSYTIKYKALYGVAHADAFNRDYGSAFNEQIDRVFDSELNRLYPGYLKEASNIAKQVGVASGKKEIYQQTFARAESNAYAGVLPAETSRVETEAVNLVQDHLNQNAALTLKGSAKLSTTNTYGISPSADADLKMIIKNIGNQASLGNSLVKITEISNNITADRKEAPLSTVAPHAHADLSVVKLHVNEAALPGSRVVIAGEIVHPGNHYRSNRVESFRIETVVAINPSIDAKLDFDTTPDIAGLFGTKKHDLELALSPKYAGVDQGYEVSLEEVGTTFVEITARPSTTEVLGRGVQKKVKFTYKLSKAAKGKTLTLKLTVKNAGKIVSQQDLSIVPK